VSLLYDLDPGLFWALAIPLGTATGAWALRLACAICSVEPPVFWRAVVTVIAVCIASGILVYWLRATVADVSLATQLILPLVTAMAILCISLSTSPGSAFLVSVVQVSICALAYLVVVMVDRCVLATL